MASSKLNELIQRTKHRYVRATTPKVLSFIGRASTRSITRAFRFSSFFAGTPSQRYMIDAIRGSFESDLPLASTIRRVLRTTNPTMQRKVANYISDAMTVCQERQKPYAEKYGAAPPYTILISPTMRCNLHCEGCFAGEYDMRSDMDEELAMRIIREANEMGINYITLLGGEPLVYPAIWRIIEKNPDTLFMMFTNGMLIDEGTAERIARLGNVIPTISLEGLEKETDERRGPGTFAKISKAMDLLRDAGVIQFYSVTATRKNVESIVSDEFIDFMTDKGASLGWCFNYVPIGRDPNMDLMPTPEQRNLLRRRALEIRDTKPILVIDFLGDGPVVGGCLAGGRHYVHVNNQGDVEPCVFSHVAVDNVKEKSLAEALNSEFFRAIRRAQPFGKNEILPCPLIDHPGAMGKLAEKYGAHPTHAGADALFNELVPPLKRYAKDMAKLYDPVWREEYGWVEQWEETWQGTFVRPERPEKKEIQTPKENRHVGPEAAAEGPEAS